MLSHLELLLVLSRIVQVFDRAYVCIRFRSGQIPSLFLLSPKKYAQSKGTFASAFLFWNSIKRQSDGVSEIICAQADAAT